MRKDFKYWFGFLSVAVGLGVVYFTLQVETIYGGDAGDLASAIVTHGIAHPPGYPLYTALGILFIDFIPSGTEAWRLGFLSTIPSLLSFIFLYDLFVYLTKRIYFSILSVLSLSFFYPIWLYGEVVEVFALNSFFTISLLWIFIHFLKEKKKKYLYLGCFILGLSLTHHHIVVFLFPVLIYLLLRCHSKARRMILGFCVRLILLFLIGLAPYLYVFISSSSNPAVNWQGGSTFVDFFNLVTRAGYGTFQAGGYIAHQPVLRLLDVWAFLDFVYKDFRIFGILLFFLGFIYLRKKDKVLWQALLIGIFSYLFFLFYASFPLVENFMVGTFERFIQPLYILMVLFFPFGFLKIELFLKRIISGIIRQTLKRKRLFQLALMLFLIYPVGLFKLNVGKISILKKDFTAENLGRDILDSIPEESILILSTDTPLFNTQYVYYTKKKWPHVKLIHLSKLFSPFYHQTLKKIYPDLSLYDLQVDSKEKFTSFIERNYHRFPIFAKMPFSLDEGIWIPHGLLFRFYKNRDVPKNEEILQINKRLWASYHDPLAGSLSYYTNLILSDVSRVYSLAHQEMGFWAAKRDFRRQAEKHLLAAEKLYPEDLDNFIILAQVYILEERCQQAEKQIEAVVKRDPEDLSSYYLLTINSAVCEKDEEKASFYQKLYEEKSRGKETLLKKL